MDDGNINAIAQLWMREGRAAASNLPWDAVETALRQLPKPAACAVSEDAMALFVLGQTDTLFTVSTDGPKVKVNSRPLNGERLSVDVEMSGATSGTRVTHWTFRYDRELESREPWQTVSGSVSVDADTGRETIDEREHFARALASRAGWSDYADGGAQGRQEERAADEVKEPKSRWRAMTDVWGRPL